MIVVNLFGAPGAGKSTGAALLFYLCKVNDINAELVTEFAKDKVWEENKTVFDNQAYIFGKQSYRLSQLRNKVDVVITDSPLPLSIFYNGQSELDENFDLMVMNVFNSYHNLNYFITRTKKYNPAGRHQDEAGSDKIAKELSAMLAGWGIPFDVVCGDYKGYITIFEEILNKLGKEKEYNVYL